MPAKAARLLEEEEEVVAVVLDLGSLGAGFAPVFVALMEQAMLQGLAELPMDPSVAALPQVCKDWNVYFGKAMPLFHDWMDTQFDAAVAAFPRFKLAMREAYNPHHYPWWNTQTQILAAELNRCQQRTRPHFDVVALPRGFFRAWVRRHFPLCNAVIPGLRHLVETQGVRYSWAWRGLLALPGAGADDYKREYPIWPLRTRHQLDTLLEIASTSFRRSGDLAIMMCEGQRVADVYAVLLLFGLFTSSRNLHHYGQRCFRRIMWEVARMQKYDRVVYCWWKTYYQRSTIHDSRWDVDVRLSIPISSDPEEEF